MRSTLRPIDWRTSTYSSNGSDCVDVRFTSTGTEIRHTKITNSPTIRFTIEQWARWIDDVVDGRITNTHETVEVSATARGRVVRDLNTGVELVFDQGEWGAFRLGARDGEFHHPGATANAR